MNKSSFKNQEQLTTWFMRVSRYHKLKIRVQTLLMAHTKAIALGAKNRFGIPTKDKAPAGLRKSNIEVRT